MERPALHPRPSARRREPTVGQEAVSSRSRRRRLVRNQRSLPRHGSALASLGLLASLWVASPLARRLWLKTALCLSAEGVATTKQRFDRAVGLEAARCAQMRPLPRRFLQRNKIAPRFRSVSWWLSTSERRIGFLCGGMSFRTLSPQKQSMPSSPPFNM